MKYFAKLLLYIVTFIISYSYSQSFIAAIISSFIVIIFLFIYNPKRRYFRAFWYVLSLLTTTNIFFFEFIASIDNSILSIKHREANNCQTICLVLLAIVLLGLDFLERSNKKITLNINRNLPHGINQNHTGEGDNVAGDKIVLRDK